MRIADWGGAFLNSTNAFELAGNGGFFAENRRQLKLTGSDFPGTDAGIDGIRPGPGFTRRLVGGIRLGFRFTRTGVGFTRRRFGITKTGLGGSRSGVGGIRSGVVAGNWRHRGTKLLPEGNRI